jgi:hypothetical protein
MGLESEMAVYHDNSRRLDLFSRVIMLVAFLLITSCQSTTNEDRPYFSFVGVHGGMLHYRQNAAANDCMLTLVDGGVSKWEFAIDAEPKGKSYLSYALAPGDYFMKIAVAAVEYDGDLFVVFKNYSSINIFKIQSDGTSRLVLDTKADPQYSNWAMSWPNVCTDNAYIYLAMRPSIKRGEPSRLNEKTLFRIALADLAEENVHIEPLWENMGEFIINEEVSMIHMYYHDEYLYLLAKGRHDPTLPDELKYTLNLYLYAVKVEEAGNSDPRLIAEWAELGDRRQIKHWDTTLWISDDNESGRLCVPIRWLLEFDPTGTSRTPITDLTNDDDRIYFLDSTGREMIYDATVHRIRSAE